MNENTERDANHNPRNSNPPNSDVSPSGGANAHCDRLDFPQLTDAGPVERWQVHLRGQVQGVGFRPFVYRLARELGLDGWVGNDPGGVLLEVEGSASATRRFFSRLSSELPPSAALAPFQPRQIARAITKNAGFEIRTFDNLPGTGSAPATAILPDLAPCPLCRFDVRDPRGRRRNYPFTNCTQCGPRFSILESLPYDRERTTMRHFELCPLCRREYEAPADRRFHAQPNACPQCGPQLAWLDAAGHPLSLAGDSHHFDLAPIPTPTFFEAELNEARSTEKEPTRNSTFVPGHSIHAMDAITAAATAIKSGSIIGLKGVGGFQLLVDATDRSAVGRLRERKGRPTKPFALMVRTLDDVRAICNVSACEAALLSSPAAPIVLLSQCHAENDELTRNWIEAVAPGQSRLGVMLPSSPLHDLLLQYFDMPLVATSGNLHSDPICTDNDEAIARLGAIADCFLVHDREIARPVDDSVAVVWQEKPRLWRRARGYAPLPFPLAHCSRPMIAMGGDQRNSLGVGMAGEAVLSQHLGDLSSEQAIITFRRVLEDLLRIYSVQPEVIAHDLHPRYQTSRIARELLGQFPNARLLPVQHHHAHLAACLAEHEISPEENACGIVWDGTGFGLDGTVWGGEFLVGNQRDFRRAATWRPFPLLGGEEAIRHPCRIALALLWQVLGTDVWQSEVGQAFPASQRGLLERLLRNADEVAGGNLPGKYHVMTSSVGRIFDGLAAVLDPSQTVHYSGEAAMRVEAMADPAETEGYPYEIQLVRKSDAGLPSNFLSDFPPNFSSDESLSTLSPWTQPARGTSREASAEMSLGNETFESNGLIQLDWRPLIAAAQRDGSRGVSPSRIAARFQLGLVTAAVEVARRVGLGRVVLSGGCFQNQRLAELTAGRLRGLGFEVLLHERVPPNDGGLSLGQLAVAAAHQQAKR